MARLLGQMLPADVDGLFEIARLAVLVRQGGEIAPGVLLELLPQFINPGADAHGTTSSSPAAWRRSDGVKLHPTKAKLKPEVPDLLDFGSRRPVRFWACPARRPR
ncbi:MAG: hypothetical protein MUF53_07535, partial [Gemmatimonadaceae bacterium]|nr:hypothetical protein [Gemmatimonadaceae bacterium]